MQDNRPSVNPASVGIPQWRELAITAMTKLELSQRNLRLEKVKVTRLRARLAHYQSNGAQVAGQRGERDIAIVADDPIQPHFAPWNEEHHAKMNTPGDIQVGLVPGPINEGGAEFVAEQRAAVDPTVAELKEALKQAKDHLYNANAQHRAIFRRVLHITNITKQALSCFVCDKPVEEPRVFPCGDIFCGACIKDWKEDPEVGHMCPFCHASLNGQSRRVPQLSRVLDTVERIEQVLGGHLAK